MSALAKFSWFIVALVAVGIALTNEQIDSYRCQDCFSRKQIVLFQIGYWTMFFPVSSPCQTVLTSHVCEDLFPPTHVHTWRFVVTARSSIFGTDWPGEGPSRTHEMTHLCGVYESNSDFRAFVLAMVEEGSLTKNRIINLLSSPDKKKDLTKEGDSLFYAFSAH